MRHEFRKYLLASAATALLACASTASAQAADPIAFNIPSQPLGAALAEFARQSSVDVLVSSQLARNQQSPALQGEMPPQQALAMLLSGSQLTYRATPNGSYVIEASDPQSGSAAGDGADQGTVQALIVTAQKREEDIQDVPIAISAFTQEDLTRSQVAGGPDLVTQVPNFTFTKTNFSSYSIQIRGIGTQAISATTDPAVAVAFNNTPFVRNRFFEQEFYDLERVEVLRGPQGTLYGRNATAGVVNIISAKPKFRFEAKASGDLGNFSSSRLEGMVNVPLVEDKVALRVAGAWTKRQGYDTNQTTGKQIDGRDLWSTRVSLRVSPSDRLDMNLIWEHFQESDDRLRSGKQLCKKDVVTEVGGVPVTSFDETLRTINITAPWVAVQPRLSQGCTRESLYSPDSFETPNGASVPYYLPLAGIGLPQTFFDPYASQVQSPNLRVIESTIEPEYRASSNIGELQVKFDLGDNLTVNSETSYSTDFVYSMQDFNRFDTKPGAFCTHIRQGNACTNSGIGDPVLKGVLDPNGVFCDPQVGCSDRLVAVDLSTGKSRQFSQEFRLSSDFDGPFNFSLGANFLRFDTVDKYYVFINSLTLAEFNAPSSMLDAQHPYMPGVSDNRVCLLDGALLGDPSHVYGYQCVYVETNSIHDIQDQGHNYFLSKNPYKLVSYAAFGEVYYNITDNLKITGGLRWTVDKKEAPRIPSWTLANDTRGYPVQEVINQEWREPTGRLALDWKPDFSFTDETLVYGSVARGYKAGGANPPPMLPVGIDATNFGGVNPSTTRPKTFEPEFVNAFELGSKNTLHDGKVTLNLAAFYYDYTGYQISEIVDRSAFNHNYDATVWGLEIESDWRPRDNLKLGFKGGYESTRIANGMQAVDLMDRTAGMPGWSVVRPFPTFASSCILPTALFTHKGTLPQAPGQPGIELTGLNPGNALFDIGGGGGAADGGCERAYFGDRDPITNLTYVASPTVDSNSLGQLSQWGTGNYPGWNPDWAPNHGEGFSKQLGGNELPNAPHYTATVTGDYTLPLANDWLMTLHSDVHWQSQSWWRVFNDNAFDKLHPYFTMNLAAIFTNEERGWNIMAYVKNVTDETAITGAFLNSDDTGLTTNVFLTEPRLYGLRVTKAWTGGSTWGGFGERHEGPYPFDIELGGQIQRIDAPNDPLSPSFLDAMNPDPNNPGSFRPNVSAAIDPRPDQQKNLDWGDGREIKVTYRPAGDWQVSLGARFGKTNGSSPYAERKESGAEFCLFSLYSCEQNPAEHYVKHNYTIASTYDREEHTLIDFMVGHDVGFGGGDHSSLSGGLRYADLESKTDLNVFGATNWFVNVDENAAKYGYGTHDRYVADVKAKRTFKGAGPMLNWDASKALLGNSDVGVLGVDWSLTGGVLFGKRKTAIDGSELKESFYQYTFTQSAGFPISTTQLPPISYERSKSVTVPTYGASLGLSYAVDRFKASAGYRWERYQNAIDGGYAMPKSEDRTVDGPYFKVSVGFGG